MNSKILIKDKIHSFNKKIPVSGDKSISIRSVLLASQAVGTSKIYNLLNLKMFKFTKMYQATWYKL